MYKDDRKYGSDVSGEETVRISNRYDPLSDKDEDINKINNIVKEKLIDCNKRKVKKKKNVLKKYVEIKNEELRQDCKKLFRKKYKKDVISIQSSSDSKSNSSLVRF